MVIGIGVLDGGGMVCRDHSVAQILSPPVDPILSLFPQTETLKPLVPYFSTETNNVQAFTICCSTSSSI